MNFYKELEREFKNAGLDGKIISVPEELKPTSKDFAELDRRIFEKTEETKNMLFLSEMYAKNSTPCGNMKILTKNRTKK